MATRSIWEYATFPRPYPGIGSPWMNEPLSRSHRAAHAVAMKQLVQIFPDIHVHTPYPTQFGSGDWITVVTRATGTFSGEMLLPNGKVIAPTGKAFDVEFGQTTKWDGDRLIIISAFLDTALQAKQLGLAE